jgi:osmotically-inducible protein OsmY
MPFQLSGLVVLIAALAAPVPVNAAAASRPSQITDQELGERVAEAVLTYAKFSIFDDISVTVEDRVVTLFGRVTVPLKKEEIEKRVADVDGVRELKSEIGVLPLSQADARLRTRVASAIYNHPAFWQYAQLANPPIHIIIENQRITLTGEVNSQVDSMLAQSLAQIPGALSVTNKLRIARR